eukprot:m.179397 g.179397  ORF g.179397 m.179397 type:complete len:351 (+) comp14756_c0_seq1:92-1144(+)
MSSEAKVSAWLRDTVGVSGTDHDDILTAFRQHGLSNIDLFQEMKYADWSNVVDKIGHRHKLAAAVHSETPRRELNALSDECRKLQDRLNRTQAKAEEHAKELARLEEQEHGIDGSIAHQRGLHRSSLNDAARARYDALCAQVDEARSINDAVRRDIDVAKEALAAALAEKEAVINRAVDTGRTSMALKSLDIPSLSPSLVKKKKPVKDRWADPTKAPWFAGDADREECVKRLLLPQCVVGDFCFRVGSTEASPYSLSFRGFGEGPDSVRHMRVTRNPQTGKLKLAKRKPDNFEADTLGDLVGYYLNIDVGDGITLRAPAPKPKPVAKSKALLPHEVEAAAAAERARTTSP